METTMNLESKIVGWGADLDPKNRPGVPREKEPHLAAGVHWSKPELQVPKSKVYKSIERPRLSAAIGTSCPPRGLSGKMRDFAYRYGEGRNAHWLTLLAADRVDMIEGILEDLAHGHIPNIYKEMGLSAEWKYNRANFVKKIAIVGVGAIALSAFFYSRRNRSLRA